MSDFDLDEDVPPPAELFARCVSLAALEAICKGDGTYTWSEDEGVYRFGFDSGAGDNLVAAFTAQGALLRAFDHEADNSPYVEEKLDARVWEDLPAELAGLLEEGGALGPERGEDLFPGPLEGRIQELPAATFALWWDDGEGDWLPEWVEEDRYENGRDWLLDRAFDSWDTDFDLPEELVNKVLAHEDLDDATLEALGAKDPLPELREQLEALGYGQPYPF